MCERARVRRGLCLALLLAACSSEEAPDAGSVPDAGTVQPIDSGPSELVEIGTGVDGFETLMADQVVGMVEGSQSGGRMGGYHVPGAIRVVGYNPSAMSVTLRVLRASDRAELGTTNRTRTLIPATDGYGFVIFDLRPALRDCCEAKNTALIMRAEVMDQDGKTGDAELAITGGPGCFDQTNRDICP